MRDIVTSPYKAARDAETASAATILQSGRTTYIRQQPHS